MNITLNKYHRLSTYRNMSVHFNLNQFDERKNKNKANFFTDFRQLNLCRCVRKLSTVISSYGGDLFSAKFFSRHSKCNTPLHDYLNFRGV